VVSITANKIKLTASHWLAIMIGPGGGIQVASHPILSIISWFWVGLEKQ